MIFFILLVFCTCSINVCSASPFSFKGTAKCTYMRKISNLVRKVMLLRSNCAVKLNFLDFSADSNHECYNVQCSHYLIIGKDLGDPLT